MITDEDVLANSDGEGGSPARPARGYDMSSSPGVTNFNIDTETEGSP